MACYFDIDYNIPGIKKNKSGDYYVSNPVLYEEIVKSKKADELTKDAVSMIILLVLNLSKKLYYSNPDDRDDCISSAIMDCILYWRGFDPKKGNNPFAYFTSIATNGMAKNWRAMGKTKFPDSIVTSLDQDKVFSL